MRADLIEVIKMLNRLSYITFQYHSSYWAPDLQGGPKMVSHYGITNVSY